MKKFIHRFYVVFKSMTGFYYFQDASSDIKNTKASTIYRLALTAIGELMIIKSDTDEQWRTVSFIEFNKSINENPDFIKWFSYLEEAVLKNQQENIDCARWNRLLVIQCVLSAFISSLDPKDVHTSSRIINFPMSMNRSVMRFLNKEINRMGLTGEVIVASQAG